MNSGPSAVSPSRLLQCARKSMRQSHVNPLQTIREQRNLAMMTAIPLLYHAIPKLNSNLKNSDSPSLNPSKKAVPGYDVPRGKKKPVCAGHDTYPGCVFFNRDKATLSRQQP
mmetsp:Transcript_14082/g.20823  ORF Transcript_14082/g.20823 Transcript_14082/m.20823 type:complete len:112 (+) Transcript_14082:2155-2490(+)